MSDEDRIRLATSCRDSNTVPKVAEAGCVFETPEGTVQIMHNGIEIFCDSHYGAYNIEVIRRLRGHHEPQEELLFHEVLKRLHKGGTIVELGAFWGYYSLWFLREVAESRAILVEPVPAALEAGKRNFRRNRSTGRFVRAAIGANPVPTGPVELWKDMVVDVATHSVDSLFDTEELTGANILHADIQGNEVQMLIGARETLRRKAIQWIFVSTHGENIHQRCLHLLREYEYRIAVEHTPGESFSVDGLIVASAEHQKPLPTIQRRHSLESALARLQATVRVRILERFGMKSITS